VRCGVGSRSRQQGAVMCSCDHRCGPFRLCDVSDCKTACSGRPGCQVCLSVTLWQGTHSLANEPRTIYAHEVCLSHTTHFSQYSNFEKKVSLLCFYNHGFIVCNTNNEANVQNLYLCTIFTLLCGGSVFLTTFLWPHVSRFVFMC
jgi:hypothetical protein